MIEHLGIVEAVQDGKTTISVATGGCRSCHKESECGIGQVAGWTSLLLIGYFLWYLVKKSRQIII